MKIKTLILIISWVFMVLSAWDEYSWSPSLKADTVYAYVGNNLSYYHVNTFYTDTKKIFTKQFNNKHECDGKYEYTYDQNDVMTLFKVCDEKGKVFHIDSLLSVDTIYNYIQLRRTFTNEQPDPFDTVWHSSKQFNYANGVILPYSKITDGNVYN